MSVTVPPLLGGGVVDGELTSYYACPKCGDTLRFMALFENSEMSQLAWGGLEASVSALSVQRVGRFIVGTVAGKAHGKRVSSYGYASYGGCSMMPFYGTDRELVRQIWARFQFHWGEIDWSKVDPMPRLGSLDCTRLEGVERVGDQMDPRAPSLLVLDSAFLRDPVEKMAGSWNYGKESYESWDRKQNHARDEFLDVVQHPRPSI